MPIKDYAEYDGMGLAALVAKGEVTPTELVEEAIARIEKHNPTLNAVIYKMYDRARETVARQGRIAAAGRRGPFFGVPFLLKDIMGNYAGVPTTAACKFMAGIPAAHDDTLVARYKAAGLVVLGKTNAPECGILPTTEPTLYGPCRNPWNLDYSTGGSSGGSAAAVAAGIVPLAHANDGGGSIRIPASCCGLVGLKPTRARTPMGPDVGDFAAGLAIDHVVSRTVRDSAAALDATHGASPGDPYYAPAVIRPFLEEVGSPAGRLRIAFSTTMLGGQRVHPECVAAVETTATLLADLGHEVTEAAPDIDMGTLSAAFVTVFSVGHAALIEGFGLLNGRVPTEADFEGLTWGLYQQGKQTPAPQYQVAIWLLQMATRRIAEFHEQYDAWVTPTLGTPPVKNGVIDRQERDPIKGMGQLFDYVPFTPIQNATGQPAISLPLHWTADGLPVGVMFAGRFGDEATLFRLAAQLEEARPWRARTPRIWD
jgi:amidase